MLEYTNTTTNYKIMSTNIIRIKRRLAGDGAATPTTSQLVNAELAFSEADQILYYGKGGDETASAEVIQIAGAGLINATVSAASANVVSLLSGVSAGLDGRVTDLETFQTHIEGLTGNGALTEGQIPVVGADGKLSTHILPALAITDTHVVSSYAEVVALSVEKGDVAIVNDTDTEGMLSKSFIFDGENWQELKTPLDAKIDQLSGQLTSAISTAVQGLENSGIASLTAAIDSLTATSQVTTLGTIASQDYSSVNITGGAISVSALTVTQGTALFNAISTSGSVTIGNGLTVESGAATLASTLGVSGAATLGSSLDVTGAVTMSNSLSVTGPVTIAGNLSGAEVYNLSGFNCYFDAGSY
jgi:hypothetical protein